MHMTITQCSHGPCGYKGVQFFCVSERSHLNMLSMNLLTNYACTIYIAMYGIEPISYFTLDLARMRTLRLFSSYVTARLLP